MIIPSIDYLLDNPPREVIIKLRRLAVFKKKEFNNNKNSLFFCLSTGRTGSKTLAVLLSHSKELLSYHEPKPHLYGMSCSFYQDESMIDRDFSKAAMLAVRSDVISLSRKLGRGYIETSPQATFIAPLILNVFPFVKFIHIVRHPADVVRSGMSRKWYAGHPADGTRIQPKNGTEEALNWNTWSAFEKNCWLWRETNQWIIDFKNNISNEKYFFIKSEDIYTGNKKVLDELNSYLSIKKLSISKINKTLNKKLNRQKGNMYPPYNEWSNENKVIFKNLVGSLAAKFGYDF